MATEGTDSQVMSGPLQCYALRFHPGQDLHARLVEFTRANNLTSAFIMTCVGSVTKARLRMANSETIKVYEGCREIVSMVGTISGGQGGHMHISLSGANGDVVGGHVMGDLIVYTTAEVMIGHIDGLNFSRPLDKETGYDELVIEKIEENKCK